MVFDRLKKAFKKFVENVSSTIAAKELSEEELEPLVEELLMELVECDVAFEAAEAIVNDLKKKLIGKRVPRFSDTRKLVVDALKEALEDLLGRAYVDKNLVSEALSRRGEPIKIVFFGVNGVGKTTTIAKFAYMFRKAGITPVIAAADTYRAGAQEQLRVHAEKIKVPFIG
ncbi:MAG TPA: signal recognition particle-docking protein FtsY, partial [Pyrodictiaceae archaeon]|nr:signal recognition particle-docking protein FtsY [Pyrodictiaceae archaeon]